MTTFESRILLIASLAVSLGVAAQPVASTPDEPSAALEGRIESDGGACLVARGLTGDPDYALGGVQRSSPYVSVTAHFDAARGSGQRVELRPCQLTFVKRG